MNEKFNISFKKHPRETGLAGIGHPYPDTDIKINKKKCGCIDSPNWNTKDNLWRVKISVIKKDINEDGNTNCIWKWVSLKYKFKGEVQAREFIKQSLETIIKRNKLEIYFFEN